MEGERAFKLSLPPLSVRPPMPALMCLSLCGYRPVPAFWYRNVRAGLRSNAAERPAPTRASLWYAAIHVVSEVESSDVPSPVPA